MNDETDLKSRLEELAATPGPAQRADVAGARARGERTIRTRRAVLASGSAAITGVLLAGVTVGLPGMNESPGRPATSAQRPGDVVQEASFGWLPAGYAMSQLAVLKEPGGADGFSVKAIANGGELGAPQIGLTVYPHGPEPMTKDVMVPSPVEHVQAPPVRGGRALWSYSPAAQKGYTQIAGRFQTTMRVVQLRWRYGATGWATLRTVGLTGTDAEITRTVYRIAESASLGDRRIRPVAVRLPTLPAALQHRTQTLLNLGRRPSLAFEFATTAYHSDLARGDTSLTLMFEAPSGGRQLRANTRIAGYPAYIKDSSNKTTGGMPFQRTVRIYGFHGYTVGIDAGGDTLRVLQSSGGLDRLIREITVR